jgi:hypothetical protein
VPCTESKRPAARPQWRRVTGVALLALALVGCATREPPAPTPTPPPAAAADKPAPRYVKLPPPPTPRNLDELKVNAARRLVAAHPDTSYMSEPPPALLGIPVLEIELNADGSVRQVLVVREPRQAKETIQMAIDAVHRAAPYGDVSRLPRPWAWREVFLFDDDHRFKPATLDR